MNSLLLTYDGAHSRVRNEEVGILAGNLGRGRASRAGEWTRLVGPVGLARPQPHRGHHGGRVQPGEHHRLRGHRLQVHLVGGSQLARHLNRRKLEPEENKTLGPEIGSDPKFNAARRELLKSELISTALNKETAP